MFFLNFFTEFLSNITNCRHTLPFIVFLIYQLGKVFYVFALFFTKEMGVSPVWSLKNL